MVMLPVGLNAQVVDGKLLGEALAMLMRRTGELVCSGERGCSGLRGSVGMGAFVVRQDAMLMCIQGEAGEVSRWGQVSVGNVAILRLNMALVVVEVVL